MKIIRSRPSGGRPPGLTDTFKAGKASECPIDLAAAMRHIEYLSEQIGPRFAGTAGERKAIDYIAQMLIGTGRPIEFQHFELPNGERSRNVSIFVPGCAEAVETRDMRGGEIVIGAHVDSTANSPGANDNASGAAILLELARVFSQERPPIDLRLVFFGGEEMIEKGQLHHHYGSRCFARSLTKQEIGCLIGMISIDMAGFGRQVKVHSTGPRSRSLCDGLIAAGAKCGVEIARMRRPASSDHESFEGVGVPASWLGFHPDPENHTPRDTVNRIDPDNLALVAQVAYSFVKNL